MQYIYRFIIPSDDFYPFVEDIVSVCVSAPCRAEADKIIEYSTYHELKLFMVEHYDKENKCFVEEDL